MADNGVRMVGATTLPQVGWPRCRWCHKDIEPISELIIRGNVHTDWIHVTTRAPICEGRKNTAEPVPSLAEEPFAVAFWDFLARHRRLRREFREVSTAKASAIRRMHDYQDMIDELEFALKDNGPDSDRFQKAVHALIQYRHEKIAAGWR